MALIKCYNCGADVSSLATQCPKCGANLQRHEVPISSNEAQPTSSKETHNKETNTWKILLIITILLLIAYFIYWYFRGRYMCW